MKIDVNKVIDVLCDCMYAEDIPRLSVQIDIIKDPLLNGFEPLGEIMSTHLLAKLETRKTVLKF